MKQDSKGRTASSPWQMPPAAWKDVAVRVWNESWADNIGLVAAGVTFYGFLAVVPLLGILVLAYGLIAEPGTVIEHMRTMMRILPADVAVLIGQLLMNAVAASKATSGVDFLIALGIALYAGGIYELVATASAFGSAGIFVVGLFGLFSRTGGAPSAYAALVAGVVVWAAGEYWLEWSTPYITAVAAALAAYLLAAPFTRARFLTPRLPLS